MENQMKIWPFTILGMLLVCVSLSHADIIRRSSLIQTERHSPSTYTASSSPDRSSDIVEDQISHSGVNEPMTAMASVTDTADYQDDEINPLQHNPTAKTANDTQKKTQYFSIEYVENQAANQRIQWDDSQERSHTVTVNNDLASGRYSDSGMYDKVETP